MKQKKNTMQKDILFLAASSFIVVVAWIGFNLYHIYVTSTVSEDVQIQLTPINPVFDQLTMQQLKTREDIKPIFDSPKIAVSPIPSEQAASPTPAPLDSGTSNVTAQNAPAASSASKLAPINSPINRVGQ